MKMPKAPVDLWDQLGEMRTAIKPPENAFTTTQYAERFSLNQMAAARELHSLCTAGRMKKAGKFGKDVYYQLI